jgi:hypothetical protein
MEIDSAFKLLIIYGTTDLNYSYYLNDQGQYRKQCKLAIVILSRFDLSLTKNE